MQHDPVLHSKTLGADLRALRKARGLTLQDIADRLGRSVGWVSQIERDLSEPSITDLRHIAKLFDVPVSLLFGTPQAAADESGYVVRAGARRPIGSGDSGLVEELLSPDLSDDFEVVHSTFQPHSRIGEVVTRPTQEVGYLVSGRLDLIISARRFTLTPGDSFRIRAEPFEWINPYDDPAVAIWVIAPPVY
ncbi:XRE family transcriptional regulator [Marivita sp.]|uniref:helix-turn-helix domain-containing protein n=1 Tax=Marivita sp. TaxID=2003365 RepID=UPI0025C287E9|nr:XRE family transcriptional regulator [Marivita sp.]